MNRHLRRSWQTVTWAGTGAAVTLTLHTALNLRALRTPPADPAVISERVSVLLPVRNEAHQVTRCLSSVLAQHGVPNLEVLVLDDASTDHTADVVRRIAAADHRVRLINGAPLPPGWLGKPHACRQLADTASGSVLVFVDADVQLAPNAVAATVAMLRDGGLDLVSPYPRQLAVSPAERLIQPLLQWSWLTTLPLRQAERSPRPALGAANGQLLAVDAGRYRRAGGHGAVRGAVLDDLALLRAIKTAGGRGGVADGTHLATCQMYAGWAELRAGYTKSLWSAFGSPAGAAAAIGGLFVVYLVPPVAALAGSRVGLVGYAAGVAGRCLSARRTGARQWPDPLAHPVSVLLLGWLTASSWRRHRRGQLSWKGRSLPGAVRPHDPVRRSGAS